MRRPRAATFRSSPLTAHALKGDDQRCLAAGMDGYLAKPIHAKELFAVIEGLDPGPCCRSR